MSPRFLLLVVVIALAAFPIPAPIVERFYSVGMYPPLQSALTAVSNRTPFVLLDGLIVAVTVLWLLPLMADIKGRPPRSWMVLRRAAVRTLTFVGVLYVVFLATWGLHYRRVPLAAKLGFDRERVTSSAQTDLVTASVTELNRLYQPDLAPNIHSAGPKTSQVSTVPTNSAGPPTFTPGPSIDASLVRAFEDAQRRLGASRFAEPGRPKRSLLLDWYFRRAGVDGMTDPFFLETMVLTDVLPVEQPMVVAHEWAHLSGYADEGEANFVGWLTCLHGARSAQYSGWLFLYAEAVRGLPASDRARAAQQLAAGPRADLQAIRERVTRSVSPVIRTAGWQVYDRYLKVNRVERGAESYSDVVQLVLGTRLGSTSVDRVANPTETVIGSRPRQR